MSIPYGTRTWGVVAKPHFPSLAAQHVARANILAKKLWRKACLFDGIEPEARFASFSAENPYAIKAGRAAILAIRLLRQL